MREGAGGSTSIVVLEDDRSTEKTAEGSGCKQGSIFDIEEDMDHCESIKAVEDRKCEPGSPINVDEEDGKHKSTLPMDIEEPGSGWKPEEVESRLLEGRGAKRRVGSMFNSEDNATEDPKLMTEAWLQFNVATDEEDPENKSMILSAEASETTKLTQELVLC